MKQKHKTKKAMAKRFKVTGSGKIMFYPAKRRHLLTGKPSHKMIKLRRARALKSVDAQRVLNLI